MGIPGDPAEDTWGGECLPRARRLDGEGWHLSLSVPRTLR